MILNLNGFLFAVQVVLLLFVGPYADYGNWRAPFLLSQFDGPAMLMTSNGNHPERMYIRFRRLDSAIPMASRQRLVCYWQYRYVLPSFSDRSLILARNLLQVFYHAAFPAMVRDLPKMIESEKQVLRGEKT